MIRLYVSKGKYHDITYSIETFTKILRNLEFEVFFKNRKRKYMLFAIKLAASESFFAEIFQSVLFHDEKAFSIYTPFCQSFGIKF